MKANCGSIRVAAFWFAMIACLAGIAGRAEAAAQTLQPFTIAVFQSEAYLADYVAKDEGFGAKHGLDIKFVTPSNGAAAAQLMLAGTVNGWTTDPLIILGAAARGYGIRMAGILAPALSYWVLVSKSDHWPSANAPLAEKIAALKGKKIAVSGIGAGTDHALLLLLKAGHLSASDVTRIGIGQQQAAIGQLEAGRIDAFVSFSLAGNAEIERQAGAHLYISTQDADVPASIRSIPSDVFAVAASLAAKDPGLVAQWQAAEQDALTWIHAHPDQAAAVLDKHVFNNEHPKLAKAIVAQMWTTYFQHTPEGFKVSQAAYKALITAGMELGIVSSPHKVTYDDLVIPAARAAN
jgi:sulfonate transport system substrate-binding protein